MRHMQPKCGGISLGCKKCQIRLPRVCWHSMHFSTQNSEHFWLLLHTSCS